VNYEWDAKKDRSNYKKHGITFDHAARVFADPQRKEGYDPEHSGVEEDRYAAIGLALDRLLFVSFTEPGPESTRIISARKANVKRGGSIMEMVRHTHETLPQVSEEYLAGVDAIRDEDIDYSDIPEVTDFSRFRPWEERRMFKPVKVAVTCKLDADVVAWLKRDGKGYQTRLNGILRKAMSQSPS